MRKKQHTAEIIDGVMGKVAEKVKGLGFLSLTVIFWVGSATLIKKIFTTIDFEKPFFVTYVSDGLNFLYFIPMLRQCKSDPSASPSPYTFKDYVKLAALFSPMLLIANYFYNEGLLLTTIASSCILANTSSIFIFLLSVPLLHSPFSLIKLLCVIVSFGGACLVGLTDSSEEGSNQNVIAGDIIALVSALLYAIYATLLKRWVKEDSQFSWPTFFMLLGVGVVGLFLPFFGILHALGIESFEWPSGTTFLFMLLNGLCGTVLPDYLWARSVILLDPLISELCIGTTIPLGMLVDFLVEGHTYSFFYILGAIYVTGGFVIITLCHSICTSISFQ